MYFSITGYAQHLNKIGKIEVEVISSLKPYRVDYDAQKIYTDSLTFEGNTWYTIETGFLTSLELANNEKDKIFYYDKKGKLKATILSNRVINLKVSKKGNFIAWYDSENIIKLNLNTFAIDTIQGTFVYAFVNQDQLIYYDPKQKGIYFNKQKATLADFPVQFVEFNSKILICTKKNLFELNYQELIAIYSFEGVFFDLKVIDDELYFVEKSEKRKETEFRLFKTKDFHQVKLVDMLTIEDD
ncbi:MAG: hypothetical protein SVU94_08555 [Bacteroidota bacterium]|nr:hypothetical protein [Bacteroidota bacterium]